MVIIKEFLPNPVGPDTAGEYITLKNIGESKVVLSGWRLVDLSSKEFSLSGYSIKPGAELTLFSQATKLRLNNGGETVFLLDQFGKVVDELVLIGIAKEGVPVIRYSELSSEVRAGIFDPLVQTGATLSQGSYLVSTVLGARLDTAFFGLAVAVLLSLGCSYIFSKLKQS